MITCVLNGGLGNQLFQVAAAYTLALDNNDVCAFDFTMNPVHQGHASQTYRNNIFKKLQDLPPKWIPQFAHKEQQVSHYKLPYHKNMRLIGFFSGDKYIGRHRQQVLDLFLDRERIDNLKRGFSGVLNNSVSLHVRRGDYLKFTDVYVQLGWDYYKKALDIIREKAQVDNILVFSDDIEWCMQHIQIKDVFFSCCLHDYCDMYLMSLCTHNIMANSSFSWWGSYLNENPNKIIVAPEKWFKTDGVSVGRPDNAEHVFCDNWIKI